jgi:hypothetical protein
MEYCPYYSAEQAYSTSFAQTNEAAGNCRATVDLGANTAKEVYGANSRCFMVNDGKPYCFEYSHSSNGRVTMIKAAGATDFASCPDGTDGTHTVVSSGITIKCPLMVEIYGQSPNLGVQGSGSAFTVPSKSDSSTNLSPYLLTAIIIIAGVVTVTAAVTLYKNLTRESAKSKTRVAVEN